MTTEQKADAILRRIVELCNQHPESGTQIGFGPDWGGNSLTVYLDGGHTHVGMDGFGWDVFVDQLHAFLCRGAGLSVKGGGDQCLTHAK